MPRLTARAPKYRKHKKSKLAVVTLAGKDHYLGPYDSKASKVEYDRLVGEWLAAGRPTAPTGEPHQITVSEVAVAFWRHAKKFYRKHGRPTGTAANYKPALTLLKQRYGHTLASEFGPLALKALQQTMVDLGQSRRYANENLHRIRKIFRWAASEQLIAISVPLALKMVEGLRKGYTEAADSDPVMPVDDAVVEATLPHLPKVVADMVKLQRLTGARPGEICSVRPADVDRSGEVWSYVPAEHKTEHHGKRRTIYVGPKAQLILLPYLLRDPDAFCFVPADSEKQRRRERHELRLTPLSCGTVPLKRRRRRNRAPGNRYTKDSYRRAVQRGCEIAYEMPDHLRKLEWNKLKANQQLSLERKAELREDAAAWRAEHVWSPNQLRHSAATEIRRKFGKDGLEAAQVVLGHSHMSTTEIYAEKRRDLAESVVREVG